MILSLIYTQLHHYSFTNIKSSTFDFYRNHKVQLSIFKQIWLQRYKKFLNYANFSQQIC